jgi:glycosyltransferase involved in cell wall biosynthesis
MNLLFDLTTIQPQPKAKFHGAGLYGETVFFALLKRTNNFAGIYDSRLHINPDILKSGIKLYDINKISFKEIINNENPDVFYVPAQRFKYNSQNVSVKKLIITMHDVRHLEMLQDEIRQYYAAINLAGIVKIIAKFFPIVKNRLEKKLSAFYYSSVHLKNADYITVSEHSKHSLISFYPHLAEKNIPVFYPPLNDEQIALPQPKFKPKSYFLLTSSARWEKNNLRAVWAFDELFSQRQDLDFKVILTSVNDEKIYAKRVKNRDKFILLGYVERAELLSLHKNAYAFIYPSLNEGFGYPPIESMRYGVPVAASGTTSIPEICQNAAIYFDPYNVSEIKNRIIQLLDKNIYAEYSERATERYKAVSERQKADLEKIADFILGKNQ